jgi:hypothetical protein
LSNKKVLRKEKERRSQIGKRGKVYGINSEGYHKYRERQNNKNVSIFTF